MEGPMQLLDLGTGPLTQILLHCEVPTILHTAQTCKALHEIAQAELVWRAKAAELFPPKTLRLDPGGYRSYRELVRRDNRLHASLVLPLRGRSCRYKYNTGSYYFECRLLALQWLRADGVFRLFFDARGEEDLRLPSQSSLGFMVRRDPAARLVEWERYHTALERRLEAATSEGERAVALQAIAQHDAQRQALTGEDGEMEPVFADLLTVMRPVHTTLAVSKEGHYLGCLIFEGLDQISTVLEELPDSYASKREALELGLQLIFCYANPVPVMPSAAMVDYHPAPLLTVLPGESVEAVMRREGRFVDNGVPLAEMREEAGEAAQAAGWAHVGEGVLRRADPPWFV